MNEKKVVIIGSGCVGSSIAFALSFIEDIKEIILLDVNEQLVEGEVMDIRSGIGNTSDAKIKSGSYHDCIDCDVIIISAGKSREVGQKREDLWSENSKIMKSIIDKIRPVYHNSFVIIVSNPVDELTQYAADQGVFPQEKLCGTGCMLDTFRLIIALSDYFKVKSSRIFAYSVGTHGDRQKVLWDEIKIDEKPIAEYCNIKNIEWNDEIKGKIHKEVTNLGMEIISKKGKTQYGIAKVVAYLIEKLFNKSKTIVSVDTNLGTLNNGVTSKLVYIGHEQLNLIKI